MVNGSALGNIAIPIEEPFAILLMLSQCVGTHSDDNMMQLGLITPNFHNLCA